MPEQRFRWANAFGEDTQNFVRVLSMLRESVRPDGDFEEMLVEKLAILLVRMTRLYQADLRLAPKLFDEFRRIWGWASRRSSQNGSVVRIRLLSYNVIPFKVKYILRLLRKNSLQIHSVCEAGCGVGEVLRLLQLEMPPDADFIGFDISPQAHELSATRMNPHLRFELADITQQRKLDFDLLLVPDVVEHLEDYFSFLRAIRGIARYKIFHFPLDFSVQAVIGTDGLLKRRRDHAHLHYFSKETAFETLTDTGYKVFGLFLRSAVQ